MTYNIKSIKQEFKQKGIFYTPPELAELLKSYVKVTPKEIYDPTCGDGALLNVFADDVIKYGQEINVEQLEIAKDRLKNFNGCCGDTLKDPAFKGKKFDCILANPPFSIKWEPIRDERFEDCPELPPASKADYAFLLHILHYLSDNGIAITLNFPGILYRTNKEGKIRQWLIENNYIERVVSIPPNTFVDTKIATALVIFKKNRTTTDIIFEDKQLNKEIVVTFEEIKQKNYNLSVSSYIQEEKPKTQVNPLQLQNIARENMYKKLRNDILVDFTICDFENYSKKEYLENIKKIIMEFEQEL